MSDVSELKNYKNEIIAKYSHRSDARAFLQILSVIIPYFLLFYICIETLYTSLPIFLVSASLLILFLMRVFMMMHDAGHECLFDTPVLNKFFGYLMGVLCGIPGYVWSQHHAYHHSTNGNWAKYRGPLSVLSVDEFNELTQQQKHKYRNSRRIWLAPFGGFMYFIFNPRFTWAKGSVDFALFYLKNRSDSKGFKELKEEFETKYWSTWKEYWHMTANNLTLLSAWVIAGAYFGWVDFFIVYVLVISLSGALGIILFTIQHNFENAYATGDADWDYYQAALTGTSYLDLPRVLHWFTADIGYHHVHHLSARIPNYRLRECHEEYKHLFNSVKRIKLMQVGEAFKYILWDESRGTLISIDQYNEYFPEYSLEQAAK